MVKSADRVLQILELIGQNREGLTHSDIASSLTIPKSSLSALLANLLEREYLSADKSGKRYLLGPQILVLAGRYLAGQDLIQIGQGVLSKLTEETGESTAMAIRDGYGILIVSKVNSSKSIIQFMNIGERRPMYATAAGKAILAHLSEEELQEYFSSVEMVPVTKKTITDRQVLEKELEKIRSGAVAYSHEEIEEGMVALSAPVFDLSGEVVATIVAGMPSIRLNPKIEKFLEKAILDSAASFSRRLGFDRRPGEG
jgi:DNA-binding IclR family transcriptional regulator